MTFVRNDSVHFLRRGKADRIPVYEIPDSIEAAEVNKRLFNEETVDLVIAHLMQNGLKVEGGDRLGKTIIFAKNKAHAKFIEQRFNAAYPASPDISRGSLRTRPGPMRRL